MSQPIGNHTLRRALRSYAVNLCHALKDNIGVITTAGLLTPRSDYQEATLELPRQHESKSDPAPGAPILIRHTASAATVQSEIDWLRDWRMNGFSGSRLVVAPPGAGKSSLIESLTLTMARALLDNKQWPPNTTLPPAVPLLIPLAKTNGRSLAEYLSIAESELTGKPAALTKDIIEHLQKLPQKRLVLLIDGFDEVPADRERLTNELLKIKQRFILTSRPGYGAEAVVRAAAHHFDIRPLTEDQQRDYVAAYFSSLSSESFTSLNAIALFDTALLTPTGPLLTRWLYLLAWCDAIRESRGRRAPTSLGELSERQLQGAIERRNLFENIRRADPHATGSYRELKETLSTFVGRLGHFLADRGFRAIQRHEIDEVGDAIFNSATVTIVGERIDLADTAIRTGLLIKNGERFSMPKIPLVEYCIGKYLVDDASLYPKTPTELIRTFSRWIWRPRLHDILDYVFDALWVAGKPDIRRWAEDLLSWAVEVGSRSPSRAKTEMSPVETDLLHPFAMSVLRWQALNRNPTDQQLALFTKTAKEVAPAFTEIMIEVSCLERLIGGPTLNVAVLDAIVTELISKPLMFKYLLHNPWWRCIKLFAGRVKQDDAAKLAQKWLDQWSASSRTCADILDRQGKGTYNTHYSELLWRLAIESACWQISPKCAANVVEQWIQSSSSPTINEIATHAWHKAIVVTASRIESKEAVACVERWIDRHVRSHNDKEKQALRAAIEGASSRVPTNVAVVTIGKWIGRALESPASDLWRIAILSAVSCVHEDDSFGVLKLLIQAYYATRNSSAKCDWGRAIKTVASGVSPSHVRKAVEYLIKHSPSHPSKFGGMEWPYTISGAARCIRGRDAVGIIQHWLMLYDSSRASGFRHRLSSAIFGALLQLEETDAKPMFDYFTVRLSRNSDFEKDMEWDSLLELVASKFTANDAYEYLKNGICRYNDSLWDELQPRWNIVLAASRRLSPTDAPDIVEDYLRHYQMTKDHSMKDHWRKVIVAAAEHVSAERLVSICNLFILEGQNSVAARIAATSGDVTIITHAPLRKKNEIAYRAVLREPSDGRNALVLDAKLQIAIPGDRVRLALLDVNSDLENPSGVSLLQELAKARVIYKNMESAQWLSRKKLFVATSVNSKRGREGLLLGELEERKFIEQKVIPNAGKKPPTVMIRITAAGQRFLSNRAADA